MSSFQRIFPEIQREVLGVALRRRRGTIAAFLAATLLASACTVGAPLVFAHAVKVIGRGELSADLLVALFAAYAGLLAGPRLLADIRMVLMHTIEHDVRLEANKVSLAALLRAAGSIFVTNNPARVSELVSSLHQSNAIYVQSFLIVVLGGTVDLAFAFGAIGALVSWSVAVVVVVYGVATVWLTLLANKATTPIQRQARRKSAEGTNLLGNVVNNVVSIKIFRGQRWVQGLYEALARGERVYWMQYFKARLGFGAMQAALVFMQYASILGMLIYTLKAPDLLNQVVLVSMILVQLNRPFEMIASAIQEYAMAQVLAEMLQSELDQHKAANAASGGTAIHARPTFAIELAGLSFAHMPEDRPLFDGVSTHFGPHGLNFIIGPSGVGKTSLLQILLGINEAYSGVIRVGGVDLRTVDKDAYLGHVGYVAQEPMLMNLSIRDNVLFGRDYPDADVIAALRTVQLGHKLDSLADGLDYKIGERGQLLSGGERQRLAIARALIGRPKVLMLDEASSALDEATERSIYASLRETAEDTTVIAVTHRLGVIGKGDRVLNLAAPASQLGERLVARFLPSGA